MKEPQPGKLVRKAIMVAKSLHDGLHPHAPRARRAEGGPVFPSLEDKFRHELTSDYQGAKARYANITKPDDTQGGRILSVDSARELSPEYRAARSRSEEVHEPASEFIKKLYAEKLAGPVAPGKKSVVLFTAGGTGSGKTSAIRQRLKDQVNEADMVYDTNLNGTASAQKKIEQALASGRRAHIAYVYRDPLEAWVHGALPRAERMGRTVPMSAHNETHAGSAKTVAELHKLYAGNPRVGFHIIDNSLGAGNAKETSLADIAHKRYTVPVEELKHALDQERQAGRISEATYRGSLGGSGAGGAGVRPVGEGLGQSPGRSPERPHPRQVNPGLEHALALSQPPQNPVT
jgi:Zeta toxin